MKSSKKTLINEINFTKHFWDRAYERLQSPSIQPPFPFESIKPLIEKLKNIYFSGQENIALQLYKSSVIYNNNGDKGNVVWVIIRGNDADTVILKDNTQPQNTQYQIKAEDLIKLAETVKPNSEGKHVISIKDVEKLRNNIQNKENISKKLLSLPIIDLGNIDWFVDEPNEKLIKVKNIKSILTFDQAFDLFSEEEMDKLLSKQFH